MQVTYCDVVTVAEEGWHDGQAQDGQIVILITFFPPHLPRNVLSFTASPKIFT